MELINWIQIRKRFASRGLPYNAMANQDEGCTGCCKRARLSSRSRKICHLSRLQDIKHPAGRGRYLFQIISPVACILGPENAPLSIICHFPRRSISHDHHQPINCAINSRTTTPSSRISGSPRRVPWEIRPMCPPESWAHMATPPRSMWWPVSLVYHLYFGKWETICFKFFFFKLRQLR